MVTHCSQSWINYLTNGPTHLSALCLNWLKPLISEQYDLKAMCKVRYQHNEPYIDKYSLVCVYIDTLKQNRLVSYKTLPCLPENRTQCEEHVI